jgi:hypothetical protein
VILRNGECCIMEWRVLYSCFLYSWSLFVLQDCVPLCVSHFPSGKWSAALPSSESQYQSIKLFLRRCCFLCSAARTCHACIHWGQCYRVIPGITGWSHEANYPSLYVSALSSPSLWPPSYLLNGKIGRRV